MRNIINNINISSTINSRIGNGIFCSFGRNITEGSFLDDYIDS